LGQLVRTVGFLGARNKGCRLAARGWEKGRDSRIYRSRGVKQEQPSWELYIIYSVRGVLWLGIHRTP